jgi:DNA-binding IclR family transcriptional regulator
MLSTIAKAGQVLDLFTIATPEWGVSEVAARLRLPKSSAHALLATLSDIGLLRHTADGRYRLGWKIPEFNHAVIESTDFLVAARNRTQQLADRLRATIHVAALHHHDVIYLDKAVGRQANDFTVSGVGRVAPVHCTALGKVLLASLDARAADALIDDHGMRRHTALTITNYGRLREELSAIRRRGWGYDLEESFSQVCCVAAPIRDINGRTQAAMSVSVPLQHFRANRDLLQRNIHRAAAIISRSGRRISSYPAI